MPMSLYNLSPLSVALVVVIWVETISMIGLFVARRFLVPRLRYGDGINDAVSGTVQAIGVFYGITVGLIAVAVWNTYGSSSNLVSQEAASIGGLYRDLGGYPSPFKEQLQQELRDYTVFVIEQAWPAQQKGQILNGSTRMLNDFQNQLFAFQPKDASQVAVHSEALHAFSALIEYRRLRVDAVNEGLSDMMWAVIWVGATISIGVAYLFKIEDGKMHAILIGLMAGFLAMVIFMIIVNDRPFYGPFSISPEPYQLILNTLIDLK